MVTDPGEKNPLQLINQSLFSFGLEMAKIYTKAIKFTNIPLS